MNLTADQIDIALVILDKFPWMVSVWGAYRAAWAVADYCALKHLVAKYGPDDGMRMFREWKNRKGRRVIKSAGKAAGHE